MTDRAGLAAVALWDFHNALDACDARDALCGLPALHEQDRGWRERASEIHLRARLLDDWANRDSLDDLNIAVDAIGAQLLALKMAIIAAQQARVP
jgi:hypothetical protein